MDQTLVDAFQHCARAYPDRPAVLGTAQSLTYGELDKASDGAASALARRFQSAGVRIAIALENSADALIAVWGCLKAGHVGVPVDSAWPAARIEHALRLVNAGALIIGEGTPIDPPPIPLLRVGSLRGATGAPRRHAGDPRDTAMIYFTSGSSGAPKAVRLSHACLLNGARNYQQALAVTPEDRIAWTAPFAHGAATGTYLTTLTAGASLLPLPVRNDAIPACIAELHAHRTNMLLLSTALFRLLARHMNPTGSLPSVRLVKLGGEPVHPADADLFARVFPPSCTLVNGLGITECGGNVCFYSWDRTPVQTPTLPIGRPAAKMEILLLDEHGRAATGGVGEIVVRSAYLADGYEGTSDPAIMSPYFTGDWGRWDERGNLVHMGTRSARLKIRGYSVDPVEVESALRALPGVQEAAVAVRQIGGYGKLVAWLQAAGGIAYRTSDVRAHLKDTLPDYALPSLVQCVRDLPRLSHGKLDRRALAEFTIQPVAGREAPRDALERQLILLWQKALGLPELGVEDDFYDAGGDSLSALALATLLEQRLGISMQGIHISQVPTPARMAAHLRESRPRETDSPLILLQAGEAGRNFFCAPGGGCDAASLIDLARRMGERYNFYGLQPPGIDGRFLPETTVESIADVLEPALKRIQTRGPYHLGGVSFGGYVAIELARRLHAQGEAVATLALFDVYGPGCLELKPGLTPIQRLRAWWCMQYPDRPRRRRETRLRRAWRVIREQTRRLRSGCWLWLRRDPARLPAELRLDYHARLCGIASQRYQPPTLHMRVDLFRARERTAEDLFRYPPGMGWTPFAAAGLREHEVPGTHVSIFRDPHAAHTASRLAAILNEKSATHPTEASHQQWEEIADWWDAALGDEGESLGARALASALMRRMDPCAGQTVLEVACGNGWLARKMAARGARVIACDFSARLLEHARRRSASSGDRIAYYKVDVASGTDWSALPATPCDAAVCNLALMDMADISLLFPNVAARLKPGAAFVCTVINPATPGLADTAPAGPLSAIGLPGQPRTHDYYHRTRAELEHLAREAGFELEAAELHAGEALVDGRHPEFLLLSFKNTGHSVE
jgi:acyl-CoA synthetase (AMP-forming)/AMP-acid ligase II/thioesterase domain-containing protein/2-polyprenyl-3-methyl-5-hydroxy-6-metoxy-1,4-benzoquinol methylase/acyl carrier protein